MEWIKNVIQKLPPVWKYIFSALVAAAMGIAIAFSPTSCSAVRASLNGGGTLSTSVNQSVADSVHISVFYKR